MTQRLAYMLQGEDGLVRLKSVLSRHKPTSTFSAQYFFCSLSSFLIQTDRKIWFHKHIYNNDLKSNYSNLFQKSAANLRVSCLLICDIFSHMSFSNYKQLAETLCICDTYPFTQTHTHIAPGSSLCLCHEPGCKGI